MAHSEVPGTQPAGRRDATPVPAGEAAVSLSDRTAEDWMPVAGSSPRFAELAVGGRQWRSRVARRLRGPDSALPGFAEASAGSEPPVPPPAVAPALFAVEAEPCLESASPRGSRRLSSKGVADWRKGPGRRGTFPLGAAKRIERSNGLLFDAS